MRIAHAVGDRQIRNDVVFVLRIEIKGVLPYFGRKVQFGLSKVAHIADQKAGPFLLEGTVARRIGTKECKPAIAWISAGIVFVLLVAMVAKAELEGVMPPDPG